MLILILVIPRNGFTNLPKHHFWQHCRTLVQLNTKFSILCNGEHETRIEKCSDTRQNCPDIIQNDQTLVEICDPAGENRAYMYT